jgi:PhnB protein
MLGNPSPHYESPTTHRERCEAAARWSETPFIVDGVHAYVDDVDAHFERARAEGARILSEVEDTPFGDRHYRAEDLEGHRWMFAEHVRDVPREEWGAR